MREAARRQARAAARPAPSWEDRLSALRRELEALDERRSVLMAERDALVDEARRAGASWPALGRLAGVSHVALLRRHSGR